VTGAPAEPRPEVVVDARGRLCPLPVIDLARRIGEAPVGGLVALLADDPAARYDVPAWCEMRGHGFAGETVNRRLARLPGPPGADPAAD